MATTSLRDRLAAESYEFTKHYQRGRGSVPAEHDRPWTMLSPLQQRFGYAQIDWLRAKVPELAAILDRDEGKLQ